MTWVTYHTPSSVSFSTSSFMSSAFGETDQPLEGLSVQAELTQATQRIVALATELTELQRRRGSVPHEQVMRLRADAATAAEAFKIAVQRLTQASRN